MANSITLRVITPDTVALDTTVDSVVLPGIDGKLGVLSGHATMVTALDIGELRYNSGGSEASMFVAGGFAEIRDNTLRVVTEAGEDALTIDETRAKHAQERAQQRIDEGDEEIDLVRAKAAMRRAAARITISSLRGHR
ncbi:MAG: F0F1 ATP synthase subunit epsilon [Planctomycetota bacterium]|nr:F0F1 ATP synthase subunit epsilon [Planctomycetota bacterium]MDG2144090.1 F0F1 ATP synthase subunit epsilon [Planctomycetota bacterium]